MLGKVDFLAVCAVRCAIHPGILGRSSPDDRGNADIRHRIAKYAMPAHPQAQSKEKNDPMMNFSA